MTVLSDCPASRDIEELVLDHLGLATALARRYSGRGVDMDDLEQVARLALVNAARRYESAQGAFAPFATATIHGELKRHFRDRAWMVRPPRRLQEIQALISAEQLPDITGANVDELAERLGVTPQELKDAAAARGCFHPDSMDDLRSRREFARDDENLDLVVEWTTVSRPLRDLDRTARQLLQWRFVDGLTQQVIADRLGISQMQVSRRISKVLDTLRGHPDLAAA